MDRHRQIDIRLARCPSSLYL